LPDLPPACAAIESSIVGIAGTTVFAPAAKRSWQSGRHRNPAIGYQSATSPAMTNSTAISLLPASPSLASVKCRDDLVFGQHEQAVRQRHDDLAADELDLNHLFHPRALLDFPDGGNVSESGKAAVPSSTQPLPTGDGVVTPFTRKASTKHAQTKKPAPMSNSPMFTSDCAANPERPAR
jgi:hypothetical protein